MANAVRKRNTSSPGNLFTAAGDVGSNANRISSTPLKHDFVARARVVGPIAPSTGPASRIGQEYRRNVKISFARRAQSSGDSPAACDRRSPGQSLTAKDASPSNQT